MSSAASPEAPRGWALVGPGNIARRFAGAVKGIPGTRLAAVVGRDAARAAAFAAQWGDADTAALTDLDAALARPDVHAVYVCTPHPQHAGAVRAALAAGKPVLCEKPLTPCAAATRPLIDLARANGVFLMEAVWTRFLPLHRRVQQRLADGAIGEVRAMQSAFCIDRPFKPGDRRYTAALGGGALLDIGLYNLTVSRLALPDVAVQGFEVQATLGGENVDVQLAATLDFGAGRTSQFTCGFFGSGDNSFRILGTRGHLVIHGGFWEATAATLHRDGAAPERIEAPFRINGFEYEIEEAMRCIRAGLAESPLLPLAESLAVVELMDAMRARIGVRYPFER
ncbi:MAG TPA: Gfo/Idh/MocA family oxidoreductase [Burkholderiaceae bacterium]|nr:Gfo/Idh/MocA family oxidoreductase [Burkholderiaceae bacterium]